MIVINNEKIRSIGVIYDVNFDDGFLHQYFGRVLNGMQAVFLENNCEMTFLGRSLSHYIDFYDICRGHNFDGVAIIEVNFKRTDIHNLIESEIPTVSLDYILDDAHDAIMSDNKVGMKSLVQYIIFRGHKKIALIYGQGDNMYVSEDRILAFKETMEENNIEVPDEYIVEGLFHDVEMNSEATSNLLSLDVPPTCIMYPDDIAALGGIREIAKRNMKVGQDISITGYDGIDIVSMLTPPLTTYRQDAEKSGKLLAEHLLARMDGKPMIESHSFVRGKLIEGGTVATIST